jgi:hypothetical protein
MVLVVSDAKDLYSDRYDILMEQCEWVHVSKPVSVRFILTLFCFLRIDLPNSRFAKGIWCLSESLPKEIALLYTYSGWLPHRHQWADCLENVVASTSHNPVGLHGLLLYTYITGNGLSLTMRYALPEDGVSVNVLQSVRGLGVYMLTSGTNERDG